MVDNFYPKITVIVPVYDTEAYIEKCLRSIMGQTFKPIEILCVDDCSPDNSISILEKLAEEDKRIRIIRHKTNTGLGGARNTGLREARGDWIASVDSDDYIDPGMMEALYLGTEGGHFDVVVCGFESVSPEGEVLSTHHQTVKNLNPIPDNTNPFTISNPSFWNKLWRKSLYLENGIFFPHHIYYQDSATTPRIYSKAKSVNFIGGVYYKYLIRLDSVTNKVSDKHLMDKFRELDVVKSYFIETGQYDTYAPFIRDRIYRSFKYHATNVAKNMPGGTQATNDYLRHLLLMRESYLILDDVVRDLPFKERSRALQEHTPLLNYEEQSAIIVPERDTPPAPLRVMPEEPRILVLTLASGEKEFERCKASLASQLYTNWDHRIFENLPNREAHKRLYTTIMENREAYDIFLKLDADMLFAGPMVLTRFVNRFKTKLDLDHFVVACDDFMTGKQIIGVHAYSNRVHWEENVEGLFLDPNPICPGRRVVDRRPSKTWFLHSPDPSEFQAFHFGAHRALKLAQRDRSMEEKRTEAFETQWNVLQNVWEQFTLHGDRRHALALLAAHRVIDGDLASDVHDYTSTSLTKAFDEVRDTPIQQIREELTRVWGDTDSIARFFERAVGPDGLRRIAIDGIFGDAPQKAFPTPAERFGPVKVPPYESFGSLYKSGREAFKRKNWEEAFERMRMALSKKGTSKYAQIGMAEALLALGRAQEASDVYRRMLTTWPEDSQVKKRYDEIERQNGKLSPITPPAIGNKK